MGQVPRFPSWRPIVWTCVFYSGLVSIVDGGPNAQHYTWISIGMFTMYAFAEMLGYGKHYFWFVMSVQLHVIPSVMIMSFDDCDVFEDAFHQNGEAVYITGNFAMHYAPSVVIYAMATRQHIFCGVQKAARQIWVSFAIYLAWYYFESPWDVYGCRLPAVLGLLGSLSLKVCFTVVMLAVQARAPPPVYTQ